MENSKLIYFFRILSRKEFRAFQQFLQSPYFNRKEEMLKLADLLWREAISEREIVEEASLYQKLTGSKSYDSARFKKLKIGLMQLLQEFLEVEQFRRSSPRRNLDFLGWLNEKSERKYFLSYHEKAGREVENADLSLPDYFFYQQKLMDELDRFRDGQPARKGSDHLQKGIEATENHFLVRMLEYLLRSANHRQITGAELHFAWKDAILAYLAEREADQIPLVQMLYRMYVVQESPDDKPAYDELRNRLSTHATALSRGERLNVYTLVINHSVRRLNQGKGEYLADIFDLYREAEASDSLLQRGKLLVWHFKNAVSIGCRLEQFAWVEDFIGKYQDSIEGDYQNNAYNFNMGVLHYCKKEFSIAQTFLFKVLQDYKDVFYGLDARALMMRIHYESGDMVGVESLCHSFRMYLDRNKALPPDRKENYHKYIRFFRRLINLPPHDKARMEALRHEIQSTWEKGSGKDWLTDTLDDKIARLKS